jgi:uracil phosphoribosyltransferase
MEMNTMSQSVEQQLQENYVTELGCLTVKNLKQHPTYKTSLEALMTKWRDERTGKLNFRSLMKNIYQMYIFPEVLEALPKENEHVVTGNNAPYDGLKFTPSLIWLTDIPRAGTLPTEVAMEDLGYILPMYGEFRIQKAVIDVKRIEDGGQLRHDVKRISLPPDVDSDPYVIILDPPLATGGTCHTAISELYNYIKCKDHRISYVFIGAAIGVPEGILKVGKLLNTLSIPSTLILAAIDPRLDDKKYIDPGVGDVGDRSCF